MELRAKQVKKYFKKQVGSPNEAIENLLTSDLEIIRNRAVNFGLLEGELTNNPLQVMIPDRFLDAEQLYRLDTKDDVSSLRYSQAAITTLFYDDARIYYHQCNLDFINGLMTDDVFGEFAIVDVVTLETFFTEGPEEDPNFTRLDLEIQLSNGSELVLTLRRIPKMDHYQSDITLTELETKFLKTIKQLVRQTF